MTRPFCEALEASRSQTSQPCLLRLFAAAVCTHARTLVL